MGLITIAELEAALGRDLDATQEAQAQALIDLFSAYATTYTGVTFTPVDDAVVRHQSDYRGVITLVPNPVREVGDTVSVLDPTLVLEVGFDGVNTLYNLNPHAWYDVTMSYGYETTPDDIKFYVTQSVIGAIANPTNLSQYRVGDVTETYSTDPSAKTPMQQAVDAILESYKTTEETWAIGPRQFMNINNLPTL